MMLQIDDRSATSAILHRRELSTAGSTRWWTRHAALTYQARGASRPRSWANSP